MSSEPKPKDPASASHPMEGEIALRSAPRLFVLLCIEALLASCAGGGGGGGGGNSGMTPAQATFTSFSAINAGKPVKATGISQTASAATTPGGVVTSTTLGAANTTASSATLTYAAPPAISAFGFSAPASSVNISSVTCTAATGVCGGSNGNAQGVVVNPLTPPTPAWNYQSFGYWLVVPSSTTTNAGVMSFGSRAPVAAIPASGTATYSGISTGVYVNQTGGVFVHAADMTSMVDFGARNIGFSTANTIISSLTLASPTAAPELDITGTLKITPGSSLFSGNVTTPGTPGMSGTATGSFYGPTAQEIGGIFSLKGSGPQTMLGGFGGVRH